MQPQCPIYLCGPIAEPGKPAMGGYQSRNLRTIEALRERKIEVHGLPYAQPGPSRVRKLIDYALGFSSLACKTAACQKNSIVHITGLRRVFLYPEIVLVYLAKLRNCLTIYDIRDGLDLDMVWLERSRIYRFFFTRILKAVDLVMVQGDRQAPLVESITGVSPVLMPNQIDLSRVTPRPYAAPDDAPVIAYAGALKREKGLETILEAAEILKRRGLDVSVRIAGTGDHAFVQELKSRQSDVEVEWLGAQTTAEVLHLFGTSHFFLFPTWWPGEGQSNALTEAMACGCVPVVSDHGFNAATVGDSGAVLDLSRNATAYADCVERIWSSGKWTELSQSAVARVHQQFSSVAIINHLTEQYAVLAAAHD